MPSLASKAKALAKSARGKAQGGVAETVQREVKKAAVAAGKGTLWGLSFRALRRQLGLTQDQAARACVVSRRSVVGWERGRAPKEATAVGLITLLGAAKAIDKVQGK